MDQILADVAEICGRNLKDKKTNCGFKKLTGIQFERFLLGESYSRKCDSQKAANTTSKEIPQREAVL